MQLIVTVIVSSRPAPPARPQPALPRIRQARELVDRYVKALAAGRQLTLRIDDLLQPAATAPRGRRT